MEFVQRIKSIKGTWTYNHKRELVIMALAVVIAWQNFSHLLPSIEWGTEVYASNEPSLYVNCDYKCLTTAWVELRTEEIMEEDMENYRSQSRIKALIEANSMILEI